MIGFMLLITASGQLALPRLKLERDSQKTDIQGKDDSLAFAYLLIGVVVSGVAASYGSFSISILMDSSGFSPSELSLTGAISGVAAIPITRFVNYISGRWGQRQALWFGYATTTLSMIIFVQADSFWHFSLAAALLWATQSANGSSALALVSVLAAPGHQGRRLSQLQTGLWGSRIISYLSVGLLMQFWSIHLALILASGLLLLSIVLIALSNRPVTPTDCPDTNCITFNPA